MISARAQDSVNVTFRLDDPAHAYTRAFVPAVFNNWGPQANDSTIASDAPSAMTYDSVNGYWTKQVRLLAGQSYPYKFFYYTSQPGADFEWIQDPLNSATDGSVYSNSVLDVGDPMVFEILQKRNSTGFTTGVLAEISSSAMVASITVKANADSISALSSFNGTTGILNCNFGQGFDTSQLLLSITVSTSGGGIASWGTTAHISSEDWEKEIFYQIFPRSFRDSNGDLIGDFDGIAQELDYLQGLGVTAIWLNPITRAHSYHNYFADNFDSTDANFGSNADFTNLVKAVHAHGMKIFIDMETQYISRYHQWYLDSYMNPGSPYGSYIEYLGPNNTAPDTSAWSFWGYDGQRLTNMALDMSTPGLMAYQKRMYATWVDPNGDGKFDDGVDGFRLDHFMNDLDNTGENPQMYTAFWKPLFDTLWSINPRLCFLVEQADWGFGNDQLVNGNADAVFSIPQMFDIESFNKNTILSGISQTLTATPPGKFQFTIIENHDVDRFASVVLNDPGKLRIGAALVLTLKGVPCLYYGQEIGMQGMKGNWGSDGDDIPDREAFKWNAIVASPGTALWYKNTGPWWTNTSLHDSDGTSLEEESVDTNSIWNFYKKLIAVRKGSPALSLGNFAAINNNNANVLSFVRTYADDTTTANVAVIINLSGSPQGASLDFSSLPAAQGVNQVVDLLGYQIFAPLTSTNNASYSVSLPNYGISIIDLRPSYAVAYRAGWNLISVPILPADPRAGAIFPSAQSAAYGYISDGYVAKDTIQQAIGYWLKLDSSQTVMISGDDTGPDTIAVAAGWNLIGSAFAPIASSSIGGAPRGMSFSNPYGYGPSGYRLADSLRPGFGYWVKTSEAGELILALPSGKEAGKGAVKNHRRSDSGVQRKVK
jgi:glycosidase